MGAGVQSRGVQISKSEKSGGFKSMKNWGGYSFSSSNFIHCLTQPRKPGSFTSARRYSKDPGALWSRDLLKIRTTRGPRGGWLKCDML